MIDDGWTELRRRAMWGVAVLLLASGVPSHAQPGPCDRYTVQGLSVGSTLADVREEFGREGVTTRIVRPGEAEGASVEYVVGDSTVYIEYNRRLDRRPEARVDLLRAPIASNAEALSELALRWGLPTVGQEELERGLADEPVVWLDERCDLAASVYRRRGSWWSGDVGTFVQLESLASVRRGESPASAALAARSSSAAPDNASPDVAPSERAEAAATAEAAASADSAPERIAYAPPVYPPNLRLMGVKGRVSLAVAVGADGSVDGARVVEAIPAGRGFEAAAVAAVKRWKYRPALQAGRAVAAEVSVVIEFR